MVAWSDRRHAMPNSEDEQAELRQELIDSASHAFNLLICDQPSPSAKLETTLSYSELGRYLPKTRRAKLDLCDISCALEWLACIFPGMALLRNKNVQVNPWANRMFAHSDQEGKSGSSDSDAGSSSSET